MLIPVNLIFNLTNHNSDSIMIIKRKLSNLFLLLLSSLFILLSTPEAYSQSKKSGAKGKIKTGYTSRLTNFNAAGEQVTRFSTLGEAIDAHDGEIAEFNGVYYLYGTSYGCGFQWGRKDAPFCGFKVYSSTDMVHWTDKGFLFDAKTPVWQSRCNGNTYGCFRPHVIFNKKTGLYVLWINVYDNVSGFRVFTSKSPLGPFAEVAEPKLAVNADAPVAGLNNGDHDTFVDQDGTGYLAFTDWRTKGTIVIEKLSDDYLTGTGECVKSITPGSTEAPSLFLRKGIYYLTYSDPNCGYCSGTGTSYRTAKSPLGPWSEGTHISNNSCGGQPSFVSPIALSSGTIFLYGSDLWNNAAKNESLANYYWAPLVFGEDGSIQPMVCQNNFELALARGSAGKQETIKDLDYTSGIKDFKWKEDITDSLQRSQGFVVKRAGILNGISVTAFKNHYPDAALKIELYKADAALKPIGEALSIYEIAADNISWSPANLEINPNIKVVAGQRYAFVIKTESRVGNYGILYKDDSKNVPSGTAVSIDKGLSFITEKNRTLKFFTTIKGKNTND